MTAPEARLGRWVLLYGILQVLSTISVDTAGLKHKDKVRYYIGPPLEGCPPWRSPDAAPLMIEACQQRSYCWLAPQTWTDSRGATGLAGSPPGYSNHQYELTEPVSGHATPDLDATAGAGIGMHRNPSILQTSLHSSSGASSSGGSRTPRGLATPASGLRGPSLNPMRSPLASPNGLTSPVSAASPLSNGYSPSLDQKGDYDLMMRSQSQRDVHAQPSNLSLPLRNPRRISPGLPANGAGSPMSPLSLDGVANSSPMLHGHGENSPSELPAREARRRDEGPPQLGQFSFLSDDNVI